MNVRWCSWGLAGLVAIGTGCATAPRKRYDQETAERLARAHVKVIEAEREARGEDPQSLALRSSARRFYQEATRALEKGEVQAAQRALEAAEADAELGVALSRGRRWDHETLAITRASAQLRQALPAADRRAGERSDDESVRGAR